MKNFILAIILILNVGLVAQVQYNPIKIEHHIFNRGEKSDCYIVYKIPYKNLVFMKKGKSYFGGVNLTFEAKLMKKDSDVIIRDTKEISINIESYDDTKSDKKYLEGLSKLELDSGKYSILPSFVLLNTKESYKLSPFNVDAAANKIIMTPIIVESKTDSANGGYKLVNYNGSIPHSLENFDVILLADNKIKSDLKCEVYQKSKKVTERKISLVEKDKYLIDKYNGQIFLTKNADGYFLNLYMIKDINKSLFEGKAAIKISYPDSAKTISEFEQKVEWMDKPQFLAMGEPAAEILEIITDEKDIDFILDEAELLNERLTQFWEKYDPNKETAFNELMSEFYNRADYALLNFNSVNKRNGAFSDRGKTYIKYGAPDKIDRVYTEKNQTNEVWIYSKLNKEFIFQDMDGLGNYTLLK
ncbi:MAG: GWxTD domain-containing protein [Melioribacteraceae bacterium]|nr:GWxTD domain-containing protein [Melioribacteraceae bacterium]